MDINSDVIRYEEETRCKAAAELTAAVAEHAAITEAGEELCQEAWQQVVQI